MKVPVVYRLVSFFKGNPVRASPIPYAARLTLGVACRGGAGHDPLPSLRKGKMPGHLLLISLYDASLTQLLRTTTLFYGITDLTTFVLGTIFIVLVPGPNSLYVMTVASRFGLSAGYRGAGGIFVGDLILMSLAATGVASLFRANPALFLALKYAGAAYLVFLGGGLLRSALSRWRGMDGTATERLEVSAPRPFRVALGISLMNPKAILFYVSFFIQFVSPAYGHPALSFLILGSIVQACSMVYLLALIFGGSFLAESFRRRRRLSAAATGGVGGLFIGFGAKLASVSA